MAYIIQIRGWIERVFGLRLRLGLGLVPATGSWWHGLG